jgi:CPA2 family monovalent cation:H+ antiporter-2
MHDSSLPVILILLVAAVVIVALFRKLKVSSVLGYLVAGAIIGPGGIGLVTDVEGTSDIAEFGVIFLLFIIGLELSWERLHALRAQAFLVGITQVVLTTSALAAGLYFMDFSVGTAVLIGGGLALSCTALGLQLLAEQNQKSSQVGRLSLAILLIQDLAVIPLLVFVPALASHEHSIGIELITVIAKGTAALVVILFIGRLLLRPLYRMIASLDDPEIFTALTLLLVLGTGWLTWKAGLSLALGAFIAGLLMAETEYRHQVEADVMPYKGLFLGLFFMVVGMSVNLQFLFHHFFLVLMLAVGLMAIKSLIIILLCRLFKFGSSVSLHTGMLLSQGGEFAFVLFGLTVQYEFISSSIAQLLTTVVTLSMALTPFSAILGRFLSRKFEKAREPTAEDSVTEMTDMRDHVIILGFGRVGQTIAKLLSAENINYIALDMQAATVAETKKIGLPVYYGDGSRREVLHAIGVERASAAIITVNDPEAAERTVHAIRAASPHLPILARAYDLDRVLALEAAGANKAISEMFEASLQLGGAALKSIGVADHEIIRIIQIFRDRDYALARGTLEIKTEEQQTPYGKMLAFHNAVVKGAVLES